MNESYDLAKLYSKRRTETALHPPPPPQSFLSWIGLGFARIFLGGIFAISAIFLVPALGTWIFPHQSYGADAYFMGLGLILAPFYFLSFVTVIVVGFTLGVYPSIPLLGRFISYGLAIVVMALVFGSVLKSICEPPLPLARPRAQPRDQNLVEKLEENPK
jgi:hypothetical protein